MQADVCALAGNPIREGVVAVGSPRFVYTWMKNGEDRGETEDRDEFLAAVNGASYIEVRTDVRYAGIANPSERESAEVIVWLGDGSPNDKPSRKVMLEWATVSDAVRQLERIVEGRQMPKDGKPKPVPTIGAHTA